MPLPAPQEASREELELRLRSAKPGTMEANAIEARLRDGDFQVGDRVLIRVLEDSALTDTFTVRAGRVLQLPDMPDIRLAGLLRSEAEDHIAAEIGRYVRNPTVQVTALMRLAVLGGVNSPGYYDLPADMVLSDVVMVAGGPSGDSKLDKTKVYRLDNEIYSSGDVQVQLASGVTLDRMNLQGGDQIRVGREQIGRIESIVRTVSLALGIPLAIYALTQIF